MMDSKASEVPKLIKKSEIEKLANTGEVSFMPFRTDDPRYHSIVNYLGCIYVRDREGDYKRFEVTPLVKECTGITLL